MSNGNDSPEVKPEVAQDSKAWYESKTIWSLVIPAILGIYQSLVLVLAQVGVHIPTIPSGLPEAIVNLITAIGVVLGMYFRFGAKTALK